jgi:hypothetical protein
VEVLAAPPLLAVKVRDGTRHVTVFLYQRVPVFCQSDHQANAGYGTNQNKFNGVEGCVVLPQEFPDHTT